MLMSACLHIHMCIQYNHRYNLIYGHFCVLNVLKNGECVLQFYVQAPNNRKEELFMKR